MIPELQEKQRKERELNSQEPVLDIWDTELEAHQDKVPPHPGEFISFEPFLDRIKDGLREEHTWKGELPADPSEIRWQNCDSRFRKPKEFLLTRQAEGRQLDEYCQSLNPQSDTEAQQFFQKVLDKMPGRPDEEISPEGPINKWSGQLTFGSYNMGNLLRKSYVPNQAGWKWKVKDSRFHMILALINRNSVHVMTIAEAEGLSHPEYRAKLKGWHLVHSHSNSLAIGVRGGQTTTIKTLWDSEDPNRIGGREYENDPTVPGVSEQFLWYMIAEIDFGKEEEGDSAFVRRAGHQHLRVLAFHINNEAAANKCYYTSSDCGRCFLTLRDISWIILEETQTRPASDFSRISAQRRSQTAVFTYIFDDS
jgi:hypothetical protein